MLKPERDGARPPLPAYVACFLALVFTLLTLTACPTVAPSPSATVVAPVVGAASTTSRPATTAPVTTVASVPSPEATRAVAATAAGAVAASRAASPVPPALPVATPPATTVATTVAGAPVADLVLGVATGQPVTVRAELVNDNQSRELGLMNRASVPEGTGMLFLFPSDTTAGFWMENTKVALSIAFIDADGAIVGLDDMQPLSRDVHQPSRAYRYALEVPQGFYAKYGIKPGDRVRYQSGADLLPLAQLPAARQAR